MSAPSLSDLPQELQTAIFASIPVRARRHPRKVCRAWAAALDKPGHWQDVGARKKHKALCFAGRRGTAEAALWAATAFGLTSEDARANIGSALRLAHENEHLEVAQWLETKFSRSSADESVSETRALRLACENGYPEVARWLASEFGAQSGSP